MKKIIALLLALSMLFALTACGGNDENTPTDESTGATTSTTEAPHTHSYSSKVTTASTCGKDGVKTFTCSCGHSYTEKIAATGQHSWQSATCTTPQTCNNCGKTEGTTSNHNYDNNGTCTKCGTVLAEATEYITFHDVFLEYYVKQSLGIQGTNKVSKYAMSKLTSFDIKEGVTDVQDLKYATNLQSISIDANNVKNLNVLCNLSKITHVSFGFLKKIDISFMKDMKQVESICYNNAEAIGGNAKDLLSSPKLKGLMAYYPPTGWSISLLEGMQNLETLDLHHGALYTDSDISALLTLPKLKTLNINIWAEYNSYSDSAKNVFQQLMQKGVTVNLG